MASPEADIKRCKFVINVSYILGKDKIAEERRITICIFDVVVEHYRKYQLGNSLKFQYKAIYL
jgi:hypothetical protein